MKISMLFLVCLTTLFALPRPVAPPHQYPGRTGLTIIALAQDGFAVAADGAQLNADGTTSEVQKIFAVSKTGAVVLAGQISTQDPVTRPVREEFNASRIAELWLNAHPDTTFEDATRALAATISKSANDFFSHRNPAREAGSYKFAVIFVSCADGKPALSGMRYFMPSSSGKPMRTEQIAAAAAPGELWIFGLAKVPEELLTGNSNALKKYKAQPAIARFRSSGVQLSAQDCLSALDEVLKLAESPQGKTFDPRHSVIGPPNRLATITAASGFALSSK